ncbi:P-loop containing nucleoside triphosphate hydrolase protein [Lasiosphaeris hirsuta]|uniref:P-loop containing nucleoside triphosphate hydrolase protein n=1 Tax=Lasiosphaeris hirsuta TaxID=260670 RepID=A0AA40B8Z5_9PEZI|nr:P-loop containing nucleoside triphosphate hydrolase protein [Lasiosphaeris hirsuta]
MPHTILRPFNILAYLQPRIKDIIGNLKRKLDDDGTTAPASTEESTPMVESQGRLRSEPPEDSSNPDVSLDIASQTGMDDRATLSHLECYAKFVDDDIISLYDSFNGTSRKRKNIIDLPLYPLRFASDAERLRDDFTSQGKMFQSLIKEPRLHYEGWSIPPELQEEPSDPDVSRRNPISRKHQKRSAPEHIEGPVIIDYEEAFNHHPLWKPRFLIPDEADRVDWTWEEVELSIMHWADKKERELLYEIKEPYLSRDTTLVMQRNEYVAKNQAIIRSRDGSLTKVDDEDIILLPRRLIAYTLRDRKFVALDVLSLRNLDNQPDIFSELKINLEHRRIILSLVKAHFESRKMQKEKPFMSLNQDLVYGKGSGLFILLHGVPGVGKTATAEAIAQYYKKPLFSITCGNLGLGPSEVEAELKEVFRLAHLWDCVLLLDKVDVFLARRDISSLKRNALVSVFLRVLEYYSGILFLTTNRVGTIDEAFKFRIHLSLYYERLTVTQTRAIFKANIKRLKAIEEQKEEHLEHTILKEARLVINEGAIMEFAESHWDNTARHSRWNGRQIRNAFQIVASLARYDMDAKHDTNEISKRKIAPVLDDKQFKLVSNVIKRFDKYFTQVRGGNDEEVALLDGIRDDSIREKDLLLTRLAHEPPTRKDKGSSRHRKATARYEDARNQDNWTSPKSSRRKPHGFEDEPVESRLEKSRPISGRASKLKSSSPRGSTSQRLSRKRHGQAEDSSSDELSIARGSESDVTRSEDRSARYEDEEF